jgi:hypothetical protein
VQLDTRLSASLVLPYDNTNGSQTGVALANQSSTATTITAVLLDQNGNQLASSQIALPALGHTSFFVTNQFSQAVNKSASSSFRIRLVLASGFCFTHAVLHFIANHSVNRMVTSEFRQSHRQPRPAVSVSFIVKSVSRRSELRREKCKANLRQRGFTDG